MKFPQFILPITEPNEASVPELPLPEPEILDIKPEIPDIKPEISAPVPTYPGPAYPNC